MSPDAPKPTDASASVGFGVLRARTDYGATDAQTANGTTAKLDEPLGLKI